MRPLNESAEAFVLHKIVYVQNENGIKDQNWIFVESFFIKCWLLY